MQRVKYHVKHELLCGGLHTEIFCKDGVLGRAASIKELFNSYMIVALQVCGGLRGVPDGTGVSSRGPAGCAPAARQDAVACRHWCPAGTSSILPLVSIIPTFHVGMLDVSPTLESSINATCHVRCFGSHSSAACIPGPSCPPGKSTASRSNAPTDSRWL